MFHMQDIYMYSLFRVRTYIRGITSRLVLATNECWQVKAEIAEIYSTIGPGL